MLITQKPPGAVRGHTQSSRGVTELLISRRARCRAAAAPTEGLSYKAAGVDITAGDELVRRIQKLNPNIGGFSGMVPFGDSFLVAGTDGVGTKLKLAFDMNKHDTVGIDLVAMSVNDIVTSGAKPLFFLDYYATGACSPALPPAMHACMPTHAGVLRAASPPSIGETRPAAQALGAGHSCGCIARRARSPRQAEPETRLLPVHADWPGCSSAPPPPTPPSLPSHRPSPTPWQASWKWTWPRMWSRASWRGAGNRAARCWAAKLQRCRAFTKR